MPIGKNRKRLQFIVSKDFAKEIEREARIMNKSISKYISLMIVKRRR